MQPHPGCVCFICSWPSNRWHAHAPVSFGSITVYPRGALELAHIRPRPIGDRLSSSSPSWVLRSRFRIQVSAELSVSCCALTNAHRGLAVLISSIQFNSNSPTLSVLPSRKLFASSLARGPCCGPPHGGRPVPTSRASPQAGTPLASIRLFHVTCSCSAVRIPRHKLLHALTLRLAPHDRKRADGVGRLGSTLARRKELHQFLMQ